MLAGGLHKDILGEKETFDERYATSSPISSLNKSQIPSAEHRVSNNANSLHQHNAIGYHFSDSDDVTFKSADLFYKSPTSKEKLGFGLDMGIFSIAQKGNSTYNGIRYGATLFYNHFSVRVGVNDYDDFTEFVPTLKYENSHKKHSYSFEYTKQNALFYTYALTPYEKRITAHHFSISDYITLKNKTDLWMNLESNIFSNDDKEFTGQFDWRFYQNTLFTPDLTYYLAVDGWYSSHSKPNNDFYSPAFSDATILRIDPEYHLLTYLSLKATLGIGYSIKDESTPYKYGLWALGTSKEKLSYSLGCLFSNAARLSNGPNYHYSECQLDLGYRW